jgi:hypothetical protein
MIKVLIFLAPLTAEYIVEDRRICLYEHEGFKYSLILDVTEYCPDNMQF